MKMVSESKLYKPVRPVICISVSLPRCIDRIDAGRRVEQGWRINGVRFD